MGASSSTTTERARLAPGTEIAGFSIERVLGEGPRGTVYEATQAGLRRRVALKIYRPEPDLSEVFAALRWPEHPHVASLYAAGPCEHGWYTATRLVREPTLAQRLARAPLDPGEAGALCDAVELALGAAHRAGIAHGAVHAANVLVDGDGRALLTDFVVPPTGADAAADLRALALLRQRCHAQTVGSGATRRSRRRRLALAAAAVICAGAGAAFALRGSERPVVAVPAPAPGVVALGSSLARPAQRSVNCDAEPASGSSLTCVVMQQRLPGRLVSVPADGAVRGWVTRGAVGSLALHVMRPRGASYTFAGRSALQRVAGSGVHRLSADLSVRRGDRLGIELAPGAAIGVADAGDGATTSRVVAPQFNTAPVTWTRDVPARLDHELLVRVDYVPGARAAQSARLAGRAAARAPAGRVLDRREVESDGLPRTVALVVLDRGVAVDLFAGVRRLMRVTVADADVRGRLLAFNISSRPDATVVWRNVDGTVVTQPYGISPSRLTL
jgi:hypothetical protein